MRVRQGDGVNAMLSQQLGWAGERRLTVRYNLKTLQASPVSGLLYVARDGT